VADHSVENCGHLNSKFKMAKHYSLRPVKPVLTETQQCLLEITNDDLIFREAQEKYGFPKSTLQRFMQMGFPIFYCQMQAYRIGI
jgi:hypothetical protein